MRRSSAFIGAAVAAASLALAAPAGATPAPTPGLSDAVSTASANLTTPGSLALKAPNSTVCVQDANLHGAGVGTDAADGFRSKPATDGTITSSAIYKPAM